MLGLHEAISDVGSEHDAIYVGGAIWAVKWVPLPAASEPAKRENASGNTPGTPENGDEVPHEQPAPSKSQRREEYLLTVSHSKGSQAELMQKVAVTLPEAELSKGSLSLWAVALDHSDEPPREEEASAGEVQEQTERALQQTTNHGRSRVRRCYTICHAWGFVARAEFCPSRAFNENRLGLLAVTSQVRSLSRSLL